MDTISFKRHRFPPDIIRHAVWLYARFALSYRNVEDLLAERGLDISHESVRRWFRVVAQFRSGHGPIPVLFECYRIRTDSGMSRLDIRFSTSHLMMASTR